MYSYVFTRRHYTHLDRWGFFTSIATKLFFKVAILYHFKQHLLEKVNYKISKKIVLIFPWTKNCSNFLAGLYFKRRTTVSVLQNLKFIQYLNEIGVEVFDFRIIFDYCSFSMLYFERLFGFLHKIIDSRIIDDRIFKILKVWNIRLFEQLFE